MQYKKPKHFVCVAQRSVHTSELRHMSRHVLLLPAWQKRQVLRWLSCKEVLAFVQTCKEEMAYARKKSKLRYREVFFGCIDFYLGGADPLVVTQLSMDFVFAVFKDLAYLWGHIRVRPKTFVNRAVYAEDSALMRKVLNADGLAHNDVKCMLICHYTIPLGNLTPTKSRIGTAFRLDRNRHKCPHAYALVDYFYRRAPSYTSIAT